MKEDNNRMKKIAINGFGRIGRLTFRQLFSDSSVEIVAINDLTDAKTLAHLLKYDSAHGNYKIHDIVATENAIIVNGKEIRIFSERNPQDLPWKNLKIDLVIEATGFFASKDAASAHLKAGAKKVVISAPAKGDLKTIVFNVNHDILNSSDKIISAASCTTNCLAPVVKVLHDKFGIEGGFMTTVHAFTNDQRTVDAPHPDLRRARAASANIIPTTTGAAAAIGLVIPELKGKLDGNSLRVPTLTGSVVDATLKLKKEVSVEELNKAIKDATNETLGYTEDPIVSSDIIGISFGSYFDALSTSKLDGQKLYKIITWYDNEMSYVNQLIRTIKYFISL